PSAGRWLTPILGLTIPAVAAAAGGSGPRMNHSAFVSGLGCDLEYPHRPIAHARPTRPALATSRLLLDYQLAILEEMRREVIAIAAAGSSRGWGRRHTDMDVFH